MQSHITMYWSNKCQNNHQNDQAIFNMQTQTQFFSQLRNLRIKLIKINTYHIAVFNNINHTTLTTSNLTKQK